MERKGFLVNKAFHQYLWASVLTVATTQIANIVDASLVGHYVGAEGLAAVTISKPLLQALYALSTLYVASSTMLTGIALGRGDRDKAHRLFTVSLLVSIGLGLLIALCGIAGLSGLSRLLCQSDGLRPMADAFMRVTLLGAMPQLLMLTLQQFVTIDGSPRLVTVSVLVGNAVNLCLDVLLMKYLGWGIAGAAWATLIMYVIIVLILLLHFRGAETLRLRLGQLRTSISPREILTLGTPLFLSTMLTSVQLGCYNAIATRYLGDNGLIALAVCIQLLTFSMIFLTGTLRTVQPVGAVLKGIGDDHGMVMLMRRAYRFLALCLLFYGLAIVFFPRPIAVFLGVTSPEAMEQVMVALPAFSLNIVLNALLYILLPVYQFYRHNRMALLLSIGQPLLPIAGFWLLSLFAGTGVNPWWGFFLGQALVALILLVCTELTRRREHLMPLLLVPAAPAQPMLEMSFGNSGDDMHLTFDALSNWLRGQQLPDNCVFRTRVIAEELMSNITRHGMQSSSHDSCADIRITVGPDAVTMVLTDDGIPFNPIENRDRGYGLMIANGAADTIHYDYRFGQNMTTVQILRA